MDLLARLVRDRVVTPVTGALNKGTAPETIADAITWGLYAGLLPLPGLTSVAAFLAVYFLSLNVVVVMAMNYAATPLQLATMLLWIRGGEWLCGMTPVAISLEPFRSDLLGSLRAYSSSLAAGAALWLVLMPLIVVPLRAATRAAVRRVVAQRARSANQAAALD